ncbi:hypothetical protein [Plasticicumulans sp.]|uniref:hypothetical protein n=1 Tax=Plasticicumulans sp. TaxID=2307179 RepID=UPI0039601C49
MTAKTALYDVPLSDYAGFYAAGEWLLLADYADHSTSPHARCGTHPRESIDSIHIDAAVCRMTGCLDAAH